MQTRHHTPKLPHRRPVANRLQAQPKPRPTRRHQDPGVPKAHLQALHRISRPKPARGLRNPKGRNICTQRRRYRALRSQRQTRKPRMRHADRAHSQCRRSGANETSREYHPKQQQHDYQQRTPRDGRLDLDRGPMTPNVDRCLHRICRPEHLHPFGSPPIVAAKILTPRTDTIRATGRQAPKSATGTGTRSRPCYVLAPVQRLLLEFSGPGASPSLHHDRSNGCLTHPPSKLLSPKANDLSSLVFGE
jgi:hypothetical protein